MDKQSLYDDLATLENELQTTLAKVRALKTQLHAFVETNTFLELENQRLREHLQELTKLDHSTKKELSKSRMNLEKLYEEGFHVCNLFYGVRRENEEECAFCLDVIYGERNQTK